ncbi:hypothetical protein AB1Y20_003840 [Prymnesium parvum]|uniref:JmjC domain-containing protein n=1 Tax=Prymnesium parvum TaxID=97485 RepID=A0AB34J625_PRYPA
MELLEVEVPVLLYSSDESDDADEPCGQEVVTADSPSTAGAHAEGYDVLSKVSALASRLAMDTSSEAARLPPEILHAEADAAYCVRRVHFSELSVAAFRQHVVSRSRAPLIITGLGDQLPCSEAGLGVDVLQAALPHDFGLPVRGRGVIPAEAFFAALAAGEQVYLADVSIARSFPWIHQLFRVPRYFTHCFTHRTRKNLSIAIDTPALFIGAAGTRSALHIDQMCSNFWMFVGQGYKRWICFHPDDAYLLSPTFDEADQINRFPSVEELSADIDCAQRMARARRVELNIGPGELLFIPQGTPHEVTNLSITTAVSANFIDQSNVEQSIAQGRAKLMHREEGSERYANLLSVLNALDEIDWPSFEDDIDVSDHVPRRAEDMFDIFPAHAKVMGMQPITLAAPTGA